MVTDAKIEEVVTNLFILFECPFRGKERGRYSLTREQVKTALGVPRLNQDTIIRLQDALLVHGLVMIDLDDVFPFVEVSVLRGYRQAPRALFGEIFPPAVIDGLADSKEEED